MLPIHEAQAVLIDLDGTLLDTAADLAAAVNLMLADLDRPALAQAQVAASVGKGAEVLVHRVLTGQADGRAPEHEHARAMPRFLHHYQSTNGQHAVPYPGVREGIEAMLSAGLRLACVTNKPQVFADPLLARLGLARCFEFVQGGGDISQAHPFSPDQGPMLASTHDGPRSCRNSSRSVPASQIGQGHLQPLSLMPLPGRLRMPAYHRAGP